LQSGFPMVRLVSPNDVVGYSEHQKAMHLSKAFDDAHRSPLSVLVLDDIERLLEFVAIGPRFSKLILQTLLVLLKKRPPAGRRLLVIGTTSAGPVLEQMEVVGVFNVSLTVPNLRVPEMTRVLTAENAFTTPEEAQRAAAMLGEQVPIKRLLMLLEMARHTHVGGQPQQLRQGGQVVPLAQWQRCIEDLSTTP